MNSKRKVDLLKYLPPFLQEYSELCQVLSAENPEFQFIIENCERTLDNTFIMYCDEQGIQRFERLLKITPAETDTLEYRRSRVMVQWGDNAPYTIKALMDKLISIQGDPNVTITLDGYNINITTAMNTKGQLDALQPLFDVMIPCNMSLHHINLVKCDVKGCIYTAIGMNCSEVVANDIPQIISSRCNVNVGIGNVNFEIIKIH